MVVSNKILIAKERMERINLSNYLADLTLFTS